MFTKMSLPKLVFQTTIVDLFFFFSFRFKLCVVFYSFGDTQLHPRSVGDQSNIEVDKIYESQEQAIKASFGHQQVGFSIENHDIYPVFLSSL